MCRAELRRLKTIYPEFSQEVDFYGVAADPTEGVAALDEQRQKEGYQWLVADPVGSMLRDMEVLVQSTKIAIDSNGVIIYRDGYGRGGEDVWRRTFQKLAATAGE